MAARPALTDDELRFVAAEAVQRRWSYSTLLHWLRANRLPADPDRTRSAYLAEGGTIPSRHNTPDPLTKD